MHSHEQLTNLAGDAARLADRSGDAFTRAFAEQILNEVADELARRAAADFTRALVPWVEVDTEHQAGHLPVRMSRSVRVF